MKEKMGNANVRKLIREPCHVLRATVGQIQDVLRDLVTFTNVYAIVDSKRQILVAKISMNVQVAVRAPSYLSRNVRTEKGDTPVFALMDMRELHKDVLLLQKK